MAGRSPLRSGTRDALVSNLDAVDTSQYQADSAGSIGRGVNQGLLGISAGAYAGDAMSAEEDNDLASASALRARAMELQNEAGQVGPQVSTFRDVNSLGSAAEYAGGAVGNAAATMAPALAGAALAIGTRGRGAPALRALGAFVPSYNMMANETLLDQAGDPAQMAQSAELRRDASRVQGVAGGALDAIVPAGLAGTLGKATGKGFGRTIAQNALEEGATETLQTRGGQLAGQYVAQGGNLDGATLLGENTDELIDAGLQGALGGGAISAPFAATNVAANAAVDAAQRAQELGGPALDSTKDALVGAKDRLSDEMDKRFGDSDADLLDKVVNGATRAVDAAKGADFQSIIDKMKEYDSKRPEYMDQLKKRVETWGDEAKAKFNPDDPDSMISALKEKDWKGISDNFKDQASKLFKGKNNLQRDIDPLVQGDAQVALLNALRPELRDMESVRSTVPEMAQRLLALSARTGGLTEQDLYAAVQLRGTMGDIFDDPQAAAESLSAMSKNGFKGMSQILDIESAATDAGKPNSFLELSMTPNKRQAGFNLKKIGSMVDQLAMGEEVTPRNREIMRGLFGTDEKAEQVLEYYRAKIRETSGVDVPEREAGDNDYDTDDFDARLQGINSQDLSEQAAAAPRHFFASAKTKRPFLRGKKVQATGVEDRKASDVGDQARLKLAKALQQARKAGADNSNVRPQLLGHGDYISQSGGDPAAELKVRLADATKRKADAMKKGKALAAKGAPEAELAQERRKVMEANKELRVLTMEGEDPRDVLNDLYQVVQVNEVDPSGVKIDDNDVFNMGRALRERTNDADKDKANKSTKLDFIGPSGSPISLSAHDIARVTSQKLEKSATPESSTARTRRAFAEGVANLLGAGYTLKEGQDIGKVVVDRRYGTTAQTQERDTTFERKGRRPKPRLAGSTSDATKDAVAEFRQAEKEFEGDELVYLEKLDALAEEYAADAKGQSPKALRAKRNLRLVKESASNTIRKMFPKPELREEEASAAELRTTAGNEDTDPKVDYLTDLENLSQALDEFLSESFDGASSAAAWGYQKSINEEIERLMADDSVTRFYEQDTGLVVGREKRGTKNVQEPSKLGDAERTKHFANNQATDREDYRAQFMAKLRNMSQPMLAATIRSTMDRGARMGDEDLRAMMGDEVAMMLERINAISPELEARARAFIKSSGSNTNAEFKDGQRVRKKSEFAPKGKRSTEGVVRDPSLPKKSDEDLRRALKVDLGSANYKGTVANALLSSPTNDGLGTEWQLKQLYADLGQQVKTQAGITEITRALSRTNSKMAIASLQTGIHGLLWNLEGNYAPGVTKKDLQSLIEAAGGRMGELYENNDTFGENELKSGRIPKTTYEDAKAAIEALSGHDNISDALASLNKAGLMNPQQSLLARTLIKSGALKGVEMDASIAEIPEGKGMFKGDWGNIDAAYQSMGELVGIEVNGRPGHKIVGDVPAVAIHESIHAATMRAEAHNVQVRRDLDRLLLHARKELSKVDGDFMAWYGFSDTQEFLAEAFSNPKFQELLKSLPALNTDTFQDMWEEFVGWVRAVIGMPKDADVTLLDEVLTIGATLIREQGYIRRVDGSPDGMGADLGSVGTKLNSQGFGNPAQTWSAAEQATVLAEIERQRGPEIKKAFDTFANIGGSGSYTYDKTTGERLIKIAMTSVNPMEVAWHESLHDFMQMMTGDKANTKMSRELLQIANSQPVITQLRTLLANHPEALKQIETDPEERLAYAYQFFLSGQLRVGTNTQSWFGKIQQFLYKILKLATTGDRAEAYFLNLHAGSFASGDPSIAAQIQAAVPTYADKMQQLSDLIGNIGEKLISSTTQRLRDTDIKALGEIADAFHVDPDQQTNKKSLPFLQRRAMANGVWANKAFTILENASQDEIRTALTHLQAQKAPSSTLEKAISDFLGDMHKYQETAGVKRLERKQNSKGIWETIEKPLTKVENYFPRIWDIDAIEENATEFMAAVDAAGGSGPKVFEAMINHRDEGKSDLADPDSFTPWNQSLDHRVLDFIDQTNAADFTKFQSQDMADILSTYVNQAVHRGEYARQFGNQGQWLDNKIKEAQAQGATPKDIKLARDAVQGLQGTLQYDMNPKLRSIMAGVMTAQNLILLPLSLFSQVVDAMAIGARSNSWKESARALDAGFKAVARSFTRNADNFTKDERLAMDLGIIDESAMLEAMGMTHHGMYLSKGMKNVNRKFFKINRMEQWNRAMRAQAVVAGQRFILASVDNARYMSELGLDKSDVVTTPEGNLAMTEADGLTPVQARKIRTAMFKFVDTAVLRPNAAHRPVWGNDPRFMLIMHLKQFSFTFQNTVLKSMKKELNFGNAKPLMVLMGAIPAIMMSDLAKAAMLGNIPPDMTFMSALGNGVARSGLLGTRAFGLDAAEDVAHGRLPGTSFLGPSFEHATVIAKGLLGVPDTDVADVAVRSIPGGSMVRDLTKE